MYASSSFAYCYHLVNVIGLFLSQSYYINWLQIYKHLRKKGSINDYLITIHGTLSLEKNHISNKERQQQPVLYPFKWAKVLGCS
jgi:hypothetical protein